MASTPEWAAVDWRAHQRWVGSQGRLVNAVVLGPERGGGDPLVFVHGVDGCWTDWLEQLSRFGRERRVVAMDLPGFGWSEPAIEPPGIDAYVRCVADVCAAAGVERAAVVGHSMGGVVAAELAAGADGRGPEVSALALAAPALLWGSRRGSGSLATSGRVLERWSDYAAGHWELALRHPRLRRAALSRAVAHPERLPREWVYEMLKPVGTATGFVEALRALGRYAPGDGVAAIAAPALVVWGEEDRLMPASFADETAALVPGARLERLADTGHCPQIERPERFNELLAELSAR
jgi:pimeloyl-ACP methyl ester carboxylesterase